MIIIDAHVHLGNGEHLQLTADDLLRMMDEANVSAAVACSVDRCLAVDNREGNDCLIAAVGQHADRIVGMASANPWYGKRAVSEVRRALEAGLLGVMIHPIYQGYWLSDPLVDPLLELARQFDVPVYAHTGTAGVAEPFHLAELAKRFPEVQFMMGHAGASDYYNDAVRATQRVENLWLESSRNGPANYQLFEAQGVLDKVVFGSAAPEYIPAVEAEIVRDTFSDKSVLLKIFEKNIRKLFKGKLPA